MSKSMSYEEYSRVPMREPRAQAMFEAVVRFDLVELGRLERVCPWSLAAPITGRKVSSALSMALCSFGSAELSELASLVPAEVLLHPVAGDWACKAMSDSPATASFQFLKLGQEHWGRTAAGELARNLCLEAGGSDEGVLAFSSSRSVWMQEDMALFWEALDGLSKERCDAGHRSRALSAAMRCWTDALGAIVRPFCEPSVDLDKLGQQASPRGKSENPHFEPRKLIAGCGLVGLEQKKGKEGKRQRKDSKPCSGSRWGAGLLG